MYLSALPVYFLGKTVRQSRSPSPAPNAHIANAQEDPEEFRTPSPTPSNTSFESADYGEALVDPEIANRLVESHKKLRQKNEDLAEKVAEAQQHASAAAYYADRKVEEARHWKQKAIQLQQENQALRETTLLRSLHKPVITSPLTPISAEQNLRKAVLQPRKRPPASENTGTIAPPAKRALLDSEKTVEDNK